MLIIAIICGAIISPFASESPDGLEWVMKKLGIQEDENRVVIKKALIHDYEFPGITREKLDATGKVIKNSEGEPEKEFAGLATAVAGLIGVIITFGFAFAIGFFIKKKKPIKVNK